MRILYPRIEMIRRSHPGKLSVGDFAVATTTTALIDFLEDLACGFADVPCYSMRHSLPFQFAFTPCDALLAPARASAFTAWSSYRLDVQWLQLPGPNEPLETRAEAEHITSTTARVSVTIASANRLCATGRTQYLNIRRRFNASTEAQTHTPTSTSNLPAAPDRRHHRYSPFLVNLLMSPIASGGEPLGRRLHPLGSIPLGAAAYQASQALGGRSPSSATLKFIRPMPIETGFSTTTTLDTAGRVTVSFFNDAGTLFAVSSLA